MEALQAQLARVVAENVYLHCRLNTMMNQLNTRGHVELTAPYGRIPVSPQNSSIGTLVYLYI